MSIYERLTRNEWELWIPIINPIDSIRCLREQIFTGLVWWKKNFDFFHILWK